LLPLTCRAGSGRHSFVEPLGFNPHNFGMQPTAFGRG
jgi:hypothetical protein